MGGLTLGENQWFLINTTPKSKDDRGIEIDDLYKVRSVSVRINYRFSRWSQTLCIFFLILNIEFMSREAYKYRTEAIHIQSIACFYK